MQICALKLPKFIPATFISTAFSYPKMRLRPAALRPGPLWGSMHPDRLADEEGVAIPSPLEPHPAFGPQISTFSPLSLSSPLPTPIPGYACDCITVGKNANMFWSRRLLSALDRRRQNVLKHFCNCSTFTCKRLQKLFFT